MCRPQWVKTVWNMIPPPPFLFSRLSPSNLFTISDRAFYKVELNGLDHAGLSKDLGFEIRVIDFTSGWRPGPV